MSAEAIVRLSGYFSQQQRHFEDSTESRYYAQLDAADADAEAIEAIADRIAALPENAPDGDAALDDWLNEADQQDRSRLWALIRARDAAGLLAEILEQVAARREIVILRAAKTEHERECAQAEISRWENNEWGRM